MAKSSKTAQKGSGSTKKQMAKEKSSSERSTKRAINIKLALVSGRGKAKKKGTGVPAKKRIATKKKAVPVKGIAKQVTGKQIISAKVVAKKNVVKKSKTPKFVAPKPATQKTFTKKKTAPKPKIVPSKISLPPVLDENVAKAANNQRQQMMVKGDGLDAAVKTEDPVRTFDKHMFEKATSKGDPHSKLHLSSAGKNPIRPSVKKTFWRK